MKSIATYPRESCQRNNQDELMKETVPKDNFIQKFTKQIFSLEISYICVMLVINK